MELAHPLQFVRSFKKNKEPKAIIAVFHHGSVEPPYELVTLKNLEEYLEQVLGETVPKSFKNELWRATIANVVYQYLRNPAVHGAGVSGALGFGQTTYGGKEMPILDFERLINCAANIIREARRRSETTGQWFGNDEIVKGPKK